MKFIKIILAAIVIVFINYNPAYCQTIPIEIAGPRAWQVNEPVTYSVVAPPGNIDLTNWNSMGGGFVEEVWRNDFEIRVIFRDAGSYFFEYDLYTLDQQHYYGSVTIDVIGSAPDEPLAANATNVTYNSFVANWGNVPEATGYVLDVSTSINFENFLIGYNGWPLQTTSKSVTGLSLNTVHYYRVRAVNLVGASAYSNTITVNPPPPVAPIATLATSIGQNKFIANWIGVPEASSYRLDVSKDIDFSTFVGSFNNLTEINVGTVVSGLSPSTTYHYRVRAVNGSGVSPNSNFISVTTPMDIPVVLTPSNITDKSFTANWMGTQEATGYRLDISRNSSFSDLVPGYNNLFITGTSQTITGLFPNTPYYYRVRAENGYGTSSNSSPITVFTAAAPLVQIAGSNAVNLYNQITYTASFNGLPIEGSYNMVSWNTSIGLNTEISRNDGAITILWTEPGTYFIEFDYYDSSNEHYYGKLDINVTSTGPVAPIISSESSITSNSFIANWIPVTGATGYRIDVSRSNSFDTFVTGFNNTPVSATNISVTGLLQGTTYYYRVRAVNASGVSVHSDIKNIITLGPPAKPLALQAVDIIANRFIARWTDVAGATEGYRLDVSTSNTFSTFVLGYDNVSIVGSNYYSVVGLSPTTDYYYRVRAVNLVGPSISSDYISVRTGTPPPAPVEIWATNVTSSSFSANWVAVSGATGYRVDVATDINFVDLLSAYANRSTGNTTTISIAGLNQVTPYFFRVRTESAMGTSSNSNTISLTTPPAAPAAPIAAEASDITSSSFKANWISVPYASSYRLDVSTDISFSGFVAGYNNVIVSGIFFNVTGLTEKTTYYYRIRAVNGTGISPNSNYIFAVNLDQNYIKEENIVTQGITTLSQVESATVNQKITKYDFYDGLGRPVQSIVKQGSPQSADIVEAFDYDKFGRDNVKYLPYVSAETDGWYKSGFVNKDHSAYTTSDQYRFYQTTPKVAQDTKPYTESRLESSPLGRVIKQGAPGEAWQPDNVNSYSSTDHTIKIAYETNDAYEVLIWTYTAPTASDPLGLVSAKNANDYVWYDSNQLFKKKAKDEQQHEMVEYTDKEGHVILKKVKVSDVEWAQTYYIYDPLGQLVMVLPPEAVKALTTLPN